MGNVGSAADKMKACEGSPKRMVPSAFRSRSVEADELCRALRGKGMCISESDMQNVLAKHDDVVG